MDSMDSTNCIIAQPGIMPRCWRCGRRGPGVLRFPDPFGALPAVERCEDELRCHARAEASQYGRVLRVTSELLHLRIAREMAGRR